MCRPLRVVVSEHDKEIEKINKWPCKISQDAKRVGPAMTEDQDSVQSGSGWGMRQVDGDRMVETAAWTEIAHDVLIESPREMCGNGAEEG